MLFRAIPIICFFDKMETVGIAVNINGKIFKKLKFTNNDFRIFLNEICCYMHVTNSEVYFDLRLKLKKKIYMELLYV